MSLRWKFALLSAALAVAAALVASTVGYVAVRNQLVSQIDDSLSVRAGRLARALGEGRVPEADRGGRFELPARESEDKAMAGASPDRPERPPIRSSGERPEAMAPGPPPAGDEPGGPGDRLFLTQTVSTTGMINPISGVVLPLDSNDGIPAPGGRPRRPRLRDAELPDGTSVRIASVQVPGVGTAQVARGLEEIEETSDRLRHRMALITMAVIALAALVGLLMARRATAPLEQLTSTAEEVAQSGNPNASITVSGRDEIGRLGRSLAQMLSSLSRSREQQQRLVQDAAHELRTPLTSLRTNIAVLDRFDRLSAEDREALISDLRTETAEMSALVDELVELSVGSEDERVSQVDLDRLVAKAAERAGKRTGREILVHGSADPVEGRPRALERAISNLLDNAAKFDGSGAPIEVTLAPGRIEVADRGPGVPDDQLELVFERFHRTIEARNLPGSGLGLSIVRQVAELHGGTAWARQREGGGLIVGFTVGADADHR